MKKYLMTAATALVLGGLMTSCTHDTDVAQTVSQDIIQQYEKVFTTAFGTPAPNQTWGFGESSSTVANTRAFTRTFDDRPQQPTFSSEPDMPTQYKKTLAEAKNISGIKNLLDGISSGGTFYVDDDDETKPWNNNEPWKVDIQNTPLTIYFDGNIIFGGNNYQNGDGITEFIVTKNSTLKLKSVRNGLKVYLAEDATLDLTDIDWCTFQNPNAAVYMCSGSTIKANYLKFVNKLTIFNNGGTIEAKYLEIDKAHLYNNGIITIKSGSGDNDGKIIIKNGENDYKAELVNNGTLTGKSMSLDAGAKFHNTLHSETTLSGATGIDNDKDCWMNDGTYECGSFTIVGNAKYIYNNCRLTVNGLFQMYESDSKFVLNGDASLVCENFKWKTAFFYMGSRSLLKVNHQLYSENDVKENRGFHGPSGNNPYAVIQAESIAKSGNNQHSMAYYGKLYVDAGSHFPQGAKDPTSNPPAQPYYYHDSSVKFSFTDENDTFTATTSPVSIDPSDCSPGYEGDDDDNKEADPDVVRIIAEDLTWGSENGDFDFNDVVFDVSLSDDKETITITLRAAGGTLPLRIAGNDDFEVHKKFGVPTGTIVNTGTALSISKPIQTWSFPNRDTRNYTLVDGQEVAQTYGNTVKEVAYNLPVEVYKLVNGTKVWVELQAPVGKAAAKVAVDNTYDWCDERESIDAKYYDRSLSRGKFSMYVKKEAPYAEDNSWYR